MTRSRVRSRIAPLVLLVLAGCADRAAEGAAVLTCGRQVFAAHWGAEMARARCVDPAITELDRSAVGASCDLPNALGCQVDDTILLANDLTDGNGPEDYRGVLAHETAHWLLSCSGLRADGDPTHKLGNVWDRGGVVDEIRACAR